MAIPSWVSGHMQTVGSATSFKKSYSPDGTSPTQYTPSWQTEPQVDPWRIGSDFTDIGSGPAALRGETLSTVQQAFFGDEAISALSTRDFSRMLNESGLYEAATEGTNVSKMDFQQFMIAMRSGDADFGGVASAEENVVLRNLAAHASPGEPFGGNLGDFGGFLQDLGQSVTDPLQQPLEDAAEFIGEDVPGAVTGEIASGIESVEEEVFDPVADAFSQLKQDFEDFFGDLFEMPEVPGIGGAGTGQGFRGESMLSRGMRVPLRNTKPSGYLTARSGASQRRPGVVSRRELGGM